MPQLAPVPGAFRVVPYFLLQGEEVRNVIHYTGPLSGASPSVAAIADAFTAEWNTNIRPLVSDLMSLYAVEVTDLETATAPGVTKAVTPPLVGGKAFEQTLPNHTAAVMTLRTALRGRSYRGRIYHCGFTEAQVNGNFIAAAVNTSLVSAYANLLALSDANGAEIARMVVVSRYANNIKRTVGIHTLVTGISSSGVVETQRRRMPGR